MCEVCTEAVHSEALWTRVTLRCGHVWSMYRGSPFRSTLNTGYIKVRTCVKYVPRQSIALWTRVTSRCGHVWSMYCTKAFHSVALWTRVTLRCGHVWSMYRGSPFRSTLNTGGHVWSMYRGSPFRSTLNTGYIKVRTCVKYVPRQSIP